MSTTFSQAGDILLLLESDEGELIWSLHPKETRIPSQTWESRAVLALPANHQRDVSRLDLGPSHMQHTKTGNEHAL